MTDVAYSTPAPDRPAEERASDRNAVLAPQRLENDFRQQSVVIRAEPALLF